MAGLRAVGTTLPIFGALVALVPASPSSAQPAPELIAVTPAVGLTAAPDPVESPSRSIGSPDRGRVRHAVELTSTPHLLVREGPRGARFGTAELVGLLHRAAARVATEHPGPRLLAGDLSAENGGRLRPHRSHRNGRDADVSFYLVDEAGRPVEAPRFVNLRRNGCGRIGEQRYCFDATRNWALAVALLADPVARVQYLLVTPYLRDRLLAEGERQGAPAELLERVRLATAIHAGSRSHRSHFHVRIYCALDDRPECVDEPPYHGWYEGTPSPGAAAAVQRRARTSRAIRRRAARRAR